MFILWARKKWSLSVSIPTKTMGLLIFKDMNEWARKVDLRNQVSAVGVRQI